VGQKSYYLSAMFASKFLLTIKSDTKEEETEIIEGFLARLQYSPTNITPIEQPDFKVELNSKYVGVEITKYFSDFSEHGSKTQRKISEWKGFAEKLKKKMIESNPGYKYLYGAINFYNDNVNYRELLKENFFVELLALLSSTNLNRNETVSLKIESQKSKLLSKYVDSLSLWNTYPEDMYLWWDSRLQTGEVIINQSAIQSIVEKKEESAKKYETEYEQKWLVIYAGGIGLGDMYLGTNQTTYRQGKVVLVNISEPQMNEVGEIISKYFTHVFLWDRFSEQITQVFPYRKKIFDAGEKSIWVDHLPL
jgi:hypothetical protein